jgi:hypothetical protein
LYAEFTKILAADSRKGNLTTNLFTYTGAYLHRLRTVNTVGELLFMFRQTSLQMYFTFITKEREPPIYTSYNHCY